VIIFDDAQRRRLLSRLDPRVRVLVVAAFAVLICLCRDAAVLCLGVAVGGLLLAVSGVRPGLAARRLGAVNLFMLFIVVTLPLFVPGAPLCRLGFLVWSRAGLWRAGQIALRANAVMIMLTALVGSMEPAYLGFALSGLGIPHKFTHLILFMVRYVELIHHEYHRLRNAMLLRGFRPRCDVRTLRTFGYLVGQLLVRSAERAERILAAMKCRGFRGRFHLLTQVRLGGLDVAFVAAAGAALAALGLMEWQ
jgi:cobalt/nickel transport system permease protein